MKKLLITSAIFILSFSFAQEAVENIALKSKVLQVFEDYNIALGEVHDGDVKIFTGQLMVAGHVMGDIRVLGGDVILEETAIVDGSIVVLGGELVIAEGAQIHGEQVEINQHTLSMRRETEEEDEDKYEYESPSIAAAFNDDLIRYNRVEGLYYQFNFVKGSSYAPGVQLYGGIGRAFSKGKFGGTLGLEALIRNEMLQLYGEGYHQAVPVNDWQMPVDFNSIAAFFIHEDFHNWYGVEGWRAGAFFHAPMNISFGAEYKDERQIYMQKTCDWALFGGHKYFAGPFDIREGQDVSLRTQLNWNQPWNWTEKKLHAHVSISRKESQSGSDFNYTRDRILLEGFIPFAEEFGIHTKFVGMRLDSKDNSIGSQHLHYLGGIGGLRGYRQDEFAGRNLYYSTIEFIGDGYGLFYDAGKTWDEAIDSDNLPSVEELQEGAWTSAGIIFGDDEDTRVEITKPLGKGKERDWRITISVPSVWKF